MPFSAYDRQDLHELLTKMKETMKMLEELKAEVARNRQVDESAKALIVGIAAKLEELANKETVDPAELAAVAAELRGSSDELAATVVANTPSAPSA